MTAIRIGIVIMGLIFAAPFIALNVWGFQTSFGYDTVIAQYKESVGRGADVSDITDLPTTPLSWLQARGDLRDTFTPDTLTNARYIIIEEVLPPQDLLFADEAMADEAFTTLYAAARAPARLIPYCADVLATIGSSCDVIHTDVRENRDGRLELTGRLAYAPTVELGDPSTVENGDLISTRISLPYTGQLRPENEAQTRQDLITQAQGICDTIREQLGNCVLTQLHLDVSELWLTDLETLPAGTNPQRLEAIARYTVYADKTQMDRPALRDLVAGIVNPS